MGLIAKLKHGTATLDIHDITNYRVMEFNPPPSGLREPFSFTLPLDVVGTTPTGIDANLMRLQNFLDLCWKDPAERSFLMLRPEAALDFEPTWGQRGASLHYQILSGRVIKPDRYGTSERVSGSLRDIALELTLAPPIGVDQVLGLSKGGVLPVRFGKNDPHTRGLVIGEATQNEFATPAFYVPPNTAVTPAWSGGILNYDTNYIFYQNKSKYVAASTGAAAVLSQEDAISGLLAVGATSLSAMVKMKDGSAVDSTIVRPLINSTSYSDATYVPLANGWYWVCKSLTTVAQTDTAGFVVQAGKACYIDACQLEGLAYPTFPMHGLQLGCSGRYDAEADRVVSSHRIPKSVLSTGQGTICIVWMPLHDHDSDRYSASVVSLFNDGTSAGFRGSYRGNDATPDFLFSDGANSCNSAELGFTAGTPVVLHYTWGGSGLRIFKDGVSIASSASFTVPTFGDYLYIGSDTTPANHSGGIFLGFTIFDRQMTAAQALAHYTEIAPLASNKQRVDWMPGIWTDDGDGIVDNCLDSTRENYAVVIDVPGQLDCETEMSVTSSVDLDTSGSGGVLISRLALEEFLSASSFYSECSGTADANSSGGEFERQAVDTTAVSFTTEVTINDRLITALADQQFYVVARIKDAGSNLQIRFLYNFSSDGAIGPDWKPITLSTSFLMRLTGQYIFKDLTRVISTIAPGSGMGIAFQAIRGVAGSANVDLDFFQVLARPLLKIFTDSTDTGPIFSYRSYDENIICYNSSGTFNSDKIYADGDRLEFMPDHYNLLVNVIGSDTGAPGAALITRTLTYNEIKVRPRWLTM